MTPHPAIATQLLSFAGAHARELVRDGRAVAALLASFAALLALLGVADAIIASTIGASTGLLRGALPLAAVIGFLAVGLVLTAVPLIRHREAGVLRTLATTPALRCAFLLGHLPIRVALLCAETVVLLAIAIAEGMPPAGIGPLSAVLLLGAGMMLSLGYLLATRMANTDVALQLSYLIPLAVLATSGALIPLEVLPSWIAPSLRILPTTGFVGDVAALVTGGTPPALHRTLASMAVVTVVSAAATSLLFRWATPAGGDRVRWTAGPSGHRSAA